MSDLQADKRTLNYAKWDKLEDSDDELESLPRNLDKESFKKYQKTQRLQRDQEQIREQNDLKARIEALGKEIRQTPLGKILRT
jgi:hypothetical protein